ncbi:hypothetical protein ACFC1W_00575 [Microbacterium sp. NPDC056003]|uniref:hypothetical protein n=1 Tax=Microbacterium sp. NPDC056003 TaxID=3345676 RepID=UPI0035DD813D
MSDPAEQPTPPTPEPTPPVAPPAPAPTAWAAPAAPPFGAPSAVAPAPTPGGTASPAGGAYAPPAGYALPAGYGTPAPAPGLHPGAVSARRSSGRGLGIVAFVLATVGTVGAALGAGISAFAIGLGAGREIAERPFTGDFDWSVLAPVRESVLLAEVSFWVGTVLGVWALAQGIVALVKDRGRVWAIVAIAVAALGPVVFFAVLQGLLTAGLGAGTGVGG